MFLEVSELRNDRGSVTVMALALTIVILAVTAVTISLGRLIIEQRQVQIAADSSALAGARELVSGMDNPCATAIEVAQRNQAHVVKCLATNSEVSVTTATFFTMLGHQMTLSAQARAGLG